MHVHSAGVGEKRAYNFISAHHKKHNNKLSTHTHTHTHTHTQSNDKWEENSQASKEVHLETRPERKNRVCLPDHAPG